MMSDYESDRLIDEKKVKCKDATEFTSIYRYVD